MISIFFGNLGVSRPGRRSTPVQRIPGRNLPAKTCWRRGDWRLSLATGLQSSPAATKESPMYLQPLLARVLITTVSILLVLVGVTAVY
jgi:hypothetical protein